MQSSLFLWWSDSNVRVLSSTCLSEVLGIHSKVVFMTKVWMKKKMKAPTSKKRLGFCFSLLAFYLLFKGDHVDMYVMDLSYNVVYRMASIGRFDFLKINAMICCLFAFVWRTCRSFRKCLKDLLAFNW